MYPSTTPSPQLGTTFLQAEDANAKLTYSTRRRIMEGRPAANLLLTPPSPNVQTSKDPKRTWIWRPEAVCSSIRGNSNITDKRKGFHRGTLLIENKGPSADGGIGGTQLRGRATSPFPGCTVAADLQFAEGGREQGTTTARSIFGKTVDMIAIMRLTWLNEIVADCFATRSREEQSRSKSKCPP